MLPHEQWRKCWRIGCTGTTKDRVTKPKATLHIREPKLISQVPSNATLKQWHIDSYSNGHPPPNNGDQLAIIYDPLPAIEATLMWYIYWYTPTLCSCRLQLTSLTPLTLTSRHTGNALPHNGMSQHNADVHRWARSCTCCQWSKVQCHTVTPPTTFTTHDSMFTSLVHSPYQTVIYTCLLTCIDRFIRGPEAIPVVDITVETVALTVVGSWISRFGIHSTNTTDGGWQ